MILFWQLMVRQDHWGSSIHTAETTAGPLLERRNVQTDPGEVAAIASEHGPGILSLTSQGV